MDKAAIKAWMERVLKETGWSAAEWGRRARTAPSNITRITSDTPGASIPKPATLEKLNTPLPASLRLDATNLTKNYSMQLASDIDLHRPVVEPFTRGAPDFPIYASAEGGNGEMILSFDPIEYVNRPLFLENVPGAYGFYCVGHSMAPRYDQGDLLLVRPGRPVTQGDDVLVILVGEGNDHHALVKQFDKWKGDLLCLKQLNPKKTVTIQRKAVHSVNLVVGRYNKSR